MTDIQKKLFELLVDLDELCAREGIEYFLSAEAALSAYRTGGFFPSCCQLSVAMTTGDAQKFIKAVEKEGRADRIVDSMCSNKNYPDFSVRYGDPNTMMMKLPYDSETALPNIAVTIQMIRYKASHKRRYHKYTKTFWKVCSRPRISVPGAKYQAAITGCHVVRDVLGGTAFSRRLFNSWADMFKKNKKAKTLSIGGGGFKHSPKLAASRSKIEFEGREFYTYGDLEGFLESYYGVYWETYLPKYTKPATDLLISAVVGYEKYLERAKKALDLKGIRANQEKLNELKGKIVPYNRKITGYYAVVDRTERRFAMWEMYMPMKDKLMQLYKEEKFEELNELLKPYRSALYACYKKKLGLCFDKDIFDITMKIMEDEGSEEYVKKLRAMVPEKHWEPMVVTDYKGEAI